MEWIITVAAGYLLGSIPSAVWFGKLFHGVDVREHGSGNAGATNVFRVLGKRTGFMVLFADILKGSLAALLPLWLPAFGKGAGTELLLNAQLAGGTAAILGHLYPVFAGFKGGKGVATMLGIMLAIQWQASLVSIGVFLLVWLLFNFISLASMSGGLVFPLAYFLLSDKQGTLMSVIAVLIPLLLIYTHRKNIRKLLNGTESKMYAFRKTKTVEK